MLNEYAVPLLREKDNYFSIASFFSCLCFNFLNNIFRAILIIDKNSLWDGLTIQIDKKSLQDGSNIQKRELYVKEEKTTRDGGRF